MSHTSKLISAAVPITPEANLKTARKMSRYSDVNKIDQTVGSSHPTLASPVRPAAATDEIGRGS